MFGDGRLGLRDSCGPAYSYSPDLGALLEILPRELARVLGLELVVERLGVVVVQTQDNYGR